MVFTEYGKEGAPTVLLMHGMLQKWQSMYELLGDLEQDYRLIIPGMDGMYEGSGTFTSFADQCWQIEEYVRERHDGCLSGVYGISQGATLMAELLARGNIRIDRAVLDGLYVAHQGKFSAKMTFRMFSKAQANGGKFPGTMNIMMKLMGLTRDDYKMLEYLYWDVSPESMRRNLLENYTLHLNPDIGKTKTEIILWRGEKEPYARKSDNILKKYVPNCEETVYQGMGHGQMLYLHGDEVCRKLRKIFE